MSSSYKIAALIALGFILFFLIGTMRDSKNDTTVTAEEKEIFAVVSKLIVPAEKGAEIVMRGKTEASRRIFVRAETSGPVIATPAKEGTFVKKGDVLCEISLESRSATEAERRAAYNKAKIDYDAAVTLFDKGFNAEAAVVTAKANLDRAVANLKIADSEIVKTKIRAAFDGMLAEQIAKPGDFLSVGAACAVMSELDPILITGALSAAEITNVTVGSNAQITLATGEQLDATVRLAAASASGATRTFKVELEAENKQNLRDGISATANIQTGSSQAYLVPHSSILINDKGIVGVRIVEGIDTQTNIGTVRFVDVNILADDAAHSWITGPKGRVNLIVRGQNYVDTGERVRLAEPENAPKLRDSSLGHERIMPSPLRKAG